jgi:hypothetical protein
MTTASARKTSHVAQLRTRPTVSHGSPKLDSSMTMMGMSAQQSRDEDRNL